MRCTASASTRGRKFRRSNSSTRSGWARQEEAGGLVEEQQVAVRRRLLPIPNLPAHQSIAEAQ